MPSIPQTSPKANYLAHKADIDSAIAEVLTGGWYILGQQVTAFEQAFAAYLGVSDAIGVASGTDAVELALRACNIGPGDLVYTVSHTAVATVVAIERCGATPVFVDIDADGACHGSARTNPGPPSRRGGILRKVGHRHHGHRHYPRWQRQQRSDSSPGRLGPSQPVSQ